LGSGSSGKGEKLSLKGICIFHEGDRFLESNFLAMTIPQSTKDNDMYKYWRNNFSYNTMLK